MVQYYNDGMLVIGNSRLLSQIVCNFLAFSGKLITEALSNYSEPDLHRCGKDLPIERDSKFLPVSEYRRKRKNFLRKALFRSENCLEQLLQSDGFNLMSKMVEKRKKTPKSTHKPSLLLAYHMQNGSVYEPHYLPRRANNKFPGNSSRGMSQSEGGESYRGRSPNNSCPSCGCSKSKSNHRNSFVPDEWTSSPAQVPVPIRLKRGSTSTTASSNKSEEKYLLDGNGRKGSSPTTSGNSPSRRSSSGPGPRRKSSNIYLSSNGNECVGPGPRSLIVPTLNSHLAMTAQRKQSANSGKHICLLSRFYASNFCFFS